jgi:hypothetical protein
MWMEGSTTFQYSNSAMPAMERNRNRIAQRTQVSGHIAAKPQHNPVRKLGSAARQGAPTVAYVVTITGCGTELEIPFYIAEGAAVLKHSIHQNAQRYGYQLYAFYHPEAAKCAAPLKDLGFIIEERDTPVRVEDIASEELREKIVKNGCCGEKELIKFEAYTLTEYPIVVLLDLDVLVLKPLDRLFDFILDSSKLPDPDDLLFSNATIPSHIELLYTTDFAMVHARRKIKPTQGGFSVLRPNRTVYNDIVSIVKKGDFRFDVNGSGWGGESGRFWGAMTFQGLMPYYYQVLHPGRSVELNWCNWNNMVSPHRDEEKRGSKCLTQQEDCEDCRVRSVKDVSLTHFTVCQKPWTCQSSWDNRLCREFHHEWFKARSDMEKSWGRSGEGPGSFNKDHFLGYCSSYGTKGYQLLSKPYGATLVALAQT